MKFTQNNVNSIHFSVPMIITLFSTYGKGMTQPEFSEAKQDILRKIFNMVMEIWDLIISGGTIYIVKSVL
jgi:hypothetical protein